MCQTAIVLHLLISFLSEPGVTPGSLLGGGAGSRGHCLPVLSLHGEVCLTRPCR